MGSNDEKNWGSKILLDAPINADSECVGDSAVYREFNNECVKQIQPKKGLCDLGFRRQNRTYF